MMTFTFVVYVLYVGLALIELKRKNTAHIKVVLMMSILALIVSFLRDRNVL